ncbi:helix-turn-helix domain-containing protein [Methyloradius palustris]|uniref:Transcriptional regulator n=1 Tax=Methyloradius palustris TaxID=2778876 RepID=A0A8D5GAB9_9PROT|nr:helix-turn-helix transcriptional regulator [Methyloradius palustris]BCM25941.1 transcriptional regulator [Methyloradius palustris]
MKATHTPGYQWLLDELIAKRKALGLTQTDLGATLGRPQSYIAKLESGEKQLDLMEFLSLAEALKLDAVSYVGKLIEKL